MAAGLAADPALLSDVTTVCLFIGHTKSGGSLLGAMLDAHPDIVIGDEVDLRRLLGARLTGAGMLLEFVRSARREAMKGRVTARRLGGYSLEIPGWSQGSGGRPSVVGNSRPGPTTRLLGDDPDSLPALRESFDGYRLAFVHVVRRPEDSIAAMVLRSGRDIVDAARDHAEQSVRLARLRAELGDAVTEVRYESLLEDAAGTLRRVLDHLGAEAPDGYLRACSALIDRGRPPESEQVTWNETARAVVAGSVRRHDFLAPYRP